jgi:CheY-like chemotaxis protein
VLLLTRLLVRRYGLKEVLTATSCAEGVRLFRTRCCALPADDATPQRWLVVCDRHLGDGEGDDVVRSMRAAEAAAAAATSGGAGGGAGVPYPALILGLTGDSDVEALRAAGCNTVLAKPVQPTVFDPWLSRGGAGGVGVPATGLAPTAGGGGGILNAVRKGMPVGKADSPLLGRRKMA